MLNSIAKLILCKVEMVGFVRPTSNRKISFPVSRYLLKNITGFISLSRGAAYFCGSIKN